MHFTRNGILNIENNGTTEKKWENEESELMVYTDADHMGCPFTLRSTGGFSIYLYRNLIGFTTAKQNCNATSSTVAEVLSVLNSVKETVWVSNLLRNIGMEWDETLIFCDSQPAINQCKHPTTHKNTRHYENKLCWIRQTLEEENIRMCYVPTELNIADIFTKPLVKEVFLRHRSQLLQLM